MDHDDSGLGDETGNHNGPTDCRLTLTILRQGNRTNITMFHYKNESGMCTRDNGRREKI